MVHALRKWRSRPFGLAAGGVAVGLAMFASGVMVARATMDSDPPANKAYAGQVGRDMILPAPAINDLASRGNATTAIGREGGVPGVAMAPDSAISKGSIGYGMGCGSDISGAAVGASVDPSKLGFASNMLKEGFTLTGISFGSEGQCGPDGDVTDPHLVLSTQWQYGSSGVHLSVTQQQTSDAVPNVIMAYGNATFATGGYSYNVYANNFYPVPMPMPVDIASDGVAAPDKPIAMPMPYPGGAQPDPEVQNAIQAAVGQLAPDIQSQCFYRQVSGGWDDLAALGIGDPRPAVPGGLAANDINVTHFEQPAAGCGGAKLEYAGQVGFNAMFSADGSYLNLGANAIDGQGGMSTQPGNVGQGNASWSNGKYWFYVNGQGSAISDDVIRKIATAMDPAFENACKISSKQLTEADVAALGVHAPVAPEGYRQENQNSMSVTTTGSCATGGEGYSLMWMFFSQGAGGVIEAGMSKGSPEAAMGRGTILDNSLVWDDSNGVTYHVSGFKGDVARDLLLGVAKSMDPDFSEGRLKANPAGSVDGGSAGGGTTSSPASPPKR